jgi:hypothetical protein
MTLGNMRGAIVAKNIAHPAIERAVLIALSTTATRLVGDNAPLTRAMMPRS